MFNLLLQKVERLKLICLQYAAAIQRLISSTSDIATNGASDSSLTVMEKYKELKLRTRSQELKLAPENANFVESILYVQISRTCSINSYLLFQLTLSHLCFIYGFAGILKKNSPLSYRAWHQS